MARLRLPGRDEWVSATVLIVGVVAGLLMIAGEFFVAYSVSVNGTSCGAVASPDVSDLCTTYGFERHSFAFLILGLFTLAMAWGAASGRSRPAGAVLILVGIIVLAVAFLRDLPDATSVGVIGVRYESARSVPGPGFYLDVAGGVLAVAAGVLRVARRR